MSNPFRSAGLPKTTLAARKATADAGIIGLSRIRNLKKVMPNPAPSHRGDVSWPTVTSDEFLELFSVTNAAATVVGFLY